MVDLKLENDEEIIQQATEVERFKANDDYTVIDEMYLTNKNLIFYYEKSNGMFKKSEEIIEKISLEDIRIVNNEVQISKVNDEDNGLGLQIVLKNGSRVHFVFENKKELQIWHDAMIETITGEKVENKKENKSFIKKDNAIFSSFMGVVDVVKDITKDQIDEVKEQVDFVKDIFIDDAEDKEMNKHIEENSKEEVKDIENKNIVNDQNKKVEKGMNSIEEMKNFIYCSKCGEKLNANSKFCNNCGTPTNNVDKEEKIVEEEKKQIKKEELTERKMVYDGKIHKCPNCGEVLNSFISNCPACGYELRDTKNSSSVEEFALKLEEIESKREKTNLASRILGTLNFADGLTKTDAQKISLIKSFPIPNTKEDLFEYLILSKTNIDLDIYEKSAVNSARYIVSEAWKSKFEQAYQKAKILFKNDDRMVEINEMHKDLNKSISKAKWKIWKIIGFMFGLMFAMFIFIAVLTGAFSNNKTMDNQSSNENSTIIETQDENTNTNIKDTNNKDDNSFNGSEVEKELKVTQYKYGEYGINHTIFIIENPTKYNLSINIEVKFYNKEGKIVGTKDGKINAFESKTKTFIYFSSDDYEKLDYNITATEEKEYNCVTSSLSYENTKSNDKEIVSLTNNGELVANFVKGYAVFFKNNEVVGTDYQYFTDNDSSLKPGKTITKELDCYNEYDSVEFFFLGSADK